MEYHYSSPPAASAMPAQLEAEQVDGIETITGIVLRYNALAQPNAALPVFERFAPGAFGDIAKEDVRALLAHDARFVLGRMSNRSLVLHDGPDALRFSLRLPDVSYARDLVELIRRGDLSGMSFGFTVPKGGDSVERTGGTTTRTIKRATLHEVSVVTWPAGIGTSAEIEPRSSNPGRPHLRIRRLACIEDVR